MILNCRAIDTGTRSSLAKPVFVFFSLRCECILSSFTGSSLVSTKNKAGGTREACGYCCAVAGEFQESMSKLKAVIGGGRVGSGDGVGIMKNLQKN